MYALLYAHLRFTAKVTDVPEIMDLILTSVVPPVRAERIFGGR